MVYSWQTTETVIRVENVVTLNGKEKKAKGKYKERKIFA